MNLLRFFVSFAIAFIMSFRGYKKKSLDLSGSISALFVGKKFFFFFGSFFYPSIKIIKIKSHVKGFVTFYFSITQGMMYFF